MTAIDDRTAETPPASWLPRCSALVPVFDLIDPVAGVGFVGTVLCGLPSVARYIGRCRCRPGHVRDAWLCGPHTQIAGEHGCRACLELKEGAHDCLLVGGPVTTRGVS